jgi:hypothetical protein
VEELSEEQIKMVIYKAVPKEWQADFIKSNQKLATTKLLALIEYMDNERGFYDRTPDTHNGNQLGRGNNSRSNGNNGSNGGNWNNKRKKNQGRGNNGNNGNKKKTLTNKDPCPLPGHGNHK